MESKKYCEILRLGVQYRDLNELWKYLMGALYLRLRSVSEYSVKDAERNSEVKMLCGVSR